MIFICFHCCKSTRMSFEENKGNSKHSGHYSTGGAPVTEVNITALSIFQASVFTSNSSRNFCWKVPDSKPAHKKRISDNWSKAGPHRKVNIFFKYVIFIKAQPGRSFHSIDQD